MLCAGLLFGDETEERDMSEYEPKCILCNHGRELRLTGHVLCELAGVTRPDFCCKHFVMNYIKLPVHRPKPRKKKSVSPEDFSL